MSPETLQENGWRITDDQYAKLKKTYDAGLHPTTIPDDHVEAPFGTQVANPLAAINEENAKVAGVRNVDRGLWKIADPTDQAEYRSRKAKTDLADAAAQEADLEHTGGMNITGQKSAKMGGQVSSRSAKDLETLTFEHDAKQRILARELKYNTDQLQKAVPAWREARATTDEASPLAQQLSQLNRASLRGIPKELYAEEHLTAKTGQGTTSPAVQESVPATEAAKGTDAPEASPVPAKAKDQNVPVAQAENPSAQKRKVSAPVTQKQITDLMQEVFEKHGSEAQGAFPQLYNAIQEKYRDPDNQAKAFFNLAKEYKANLDNKTGDPLTPVLDKLDKLPPEKGSSTLHANPLVAMFRSFSKASKPALGVEPSLLKSFGAIDPLPIEHLTAALDAKGAAPTSERRQAWFNNEIQRAQRAVEELPSDLASKRQALTNAFKSILSAYKDRSGPTMWEMAKRTADVTILQGGQELADFHKKMVQTFPDRERRSALVAWVEAHRGPEGPVLEGQPRLRLTDDEASSVLKSQTDQLALKKAFGGGDRYVTKIFKTAQTLTPNEKAFAHEYKKYDEMLTAREEAAGLHHEVLMDYFQHIWKPSNFAQAALSGLRGSTGFSTAANFSRMRTKLTYFEGLQSGLSPKDLDAAFLIQHRAEASARVIANRQLVEALQHITMPDGSPMVRIKGIGMTPEPNGDSKGAILIKSGLPKDAITADGRRYMDINHPAFKDWKWLGSTADGKSILGLNDMVIHPDAFKEVHAQFTPSAFGANSFGRAVMTGSAAIKMNTLSWSLFHAKALAEHALQHKAVGLLHGSPTDFSTMNPFHESIIDMNKPLHQFAVMTGLNLRGAHSGSMEMEGLAGLSRLPVIGAAWKPVHELMFNQFIPNLAMSGWEEGYQRNLNRYHEQYVGEELNKMGHSGPVSTIPQQAFADASQMAQWRIGKMTSDQVNYSYGLMRLEDVPGLRSKTAQDVARLVTLAPNFLASRGALLVDAVRPGGAESAQAAALGAFTTWALCRMINYYANDGDSKNGLREWNKVVIGHSEYNFRSEVSDALDAYLDPRTFITHRLNPIWRPAAEEMTQKDVYGHHASQGQIAIDALKMNMPIPIQGMVDQFAPYFNSNLRNSKGGEGTLDSLMSGIGIQRRQYRTEAERQVYQAFDRIQAQPSQDTLTMEQRNKFLDLRDKYRAGKLSSTDITDAMNDPNGNLKPSEVKYLFKTANKSQLVNQAQHLQYDEVHSAWDKANPMERMELAPVLMSKVKNLPIPSRAAAYEELRQYQLSLSQQDRDKLNKEMQAQIQWETTKK